MVTRISGAGMLGALPSSAKAATRIAGLLSPRMCHAAGLTVRWSRSVSPTRVPAGVVLSLGTAVGSAAWLRDARVVPATTKSRGMMRRTATPRSATRANVVRGRACLKDVRTTLARGPLAFSTRSRTIIATPVFAGESVTGKEADYGSQIPYGILRRSVLDHRLQHAVSAGGNRPGDHGSSRAVPHGSGLGNRLGEERGITSHRERRRCDGLGCVGLRDGGEREER